MVTKLQSKKPKFLRTTLLLIVASIFLLATIYPAEASLLVSDYAVSTATVKTSSVALAAGNSGESAISITNDYATLTATAGLTFNQQSDMLSITPTAPSIDGSARAYFSSATTGACTLSTGTAGDLIYVAIQILGTNTVSKVNNTGTALTWTQRAAIGNGASVRIETWYAYSSAVFSFQNINVYFASATTFAIVAFGVKNVDPQNFFEDSASTPATGTGASTSQAVSVSTSLNNVLLIGTIAVKVASGTSPSPTVGTGYSVIQSNHLNTLGYAAESAALTTAVSSYPINCSTGVTSVSWAMIGDAVWGPLTSPSVNTAFTVPASSGGISLGDGRGGYLISPAYPRATTIYTGTYQLNLWASASSSARMEIYLLVTDSSYNILSSVTGKVNTATIPTTKTLVNSTFSGVQVVVPSGGHLVVELWNPSGGANSFTVYWGSGQITNFRTPQVFDYVLQVVNSGATSFSVGVSTYSSTSISRLANFTLSVYSPASKCIVITNGVFMQTASSTLALPAATTFYLAVNASASDFNSVSNLVLQLKFASTTRPFAYDTINITIN
jgi:hypothetical protein